MLFSIHFLCGWFLVWGALYGLYLLSRIGGIIIHKEGLKLKKALVFLVLSAFMITATFSMKHIGITAIVEHPALESVRQGILDQLANYGMIQGEHYKEFYETAQGDMNRATSIAQQFSSSKLDLVVGISTPSAQALANTIQDLPVVFSAVTDPVSASLVEKLGINSSNVVGISDMAPVETQIQLMKEITPQSERVGIIYNPEEANSVFITEAARTACGKLGLSLIEIRGSSPSEMISALDAVVEDLDFLYIGKDNMAASIISAIGQIAEASNIPIMAGAISLAKEVGIAGLAFDDYSVGLETGRLVYQILQGVSPSHLESRVLSADFLILYINLDRAQAMGIEIPDHVLVQADRITQNGHEKGLEDR